MAEGDTRAGGRASVLAELAPPVALIGLSVYLWTLADRFTEGARRYEAIGPDFFPKLLLALLVALCISQVAAIAVRRGAAADASASRVYWTDLAVAVAITAAYAALLSPVGFLLATPLFQGALLTVVFRVRNAVVLVLTPLAFTAGLALLFVGVMNAPLPRGRWIFGEFSRLFY